MTILNQVTAQAQVRAGHQGGVDTGNVEPLFIEEYGGEVDRVMYEDSVMRQFFNIKSIRGTNMVTNHRLGATSLQKVTRNQRPVDHSPTFDNISIQVDTMVLARSTQALIDDFLVSLDVRQEMGQNHGEEIAEFFDKSFLVQGIKACQVTNKVPVKDATTNAVTGSKLVGGWEDAYGAGTNAAFTGTKPANIVRTAPEKFRGGTVVALANAGDELDPENLELAIQDMCQKIEEKKIKLKKGVLLMRPAQYYALLKNDKLLNKDFVNANGDYSEGTVLKASGLRVMTTNNFPQQGEVGEEHFLSNAGNGNAYDIVQADVNCVALFLMPKALLAGELIPLTSNVHYNETELQWFIDSYLSFAVTPNRAEAAAGIFTSTPTESFDQHTATTE